MHVGLAAELAIQMHSAASEMFSARASAADSRLGGVGHTSDCGMCSGTVTRLLRTCAARQHDAQLQHTSPCASQRQLTAVSWVQSTMEYHWGKHHQTYVNNMNKQLEGSDLDGKPLEEVRFHDLLLPACG